MKRAFLATGALAAAVLLSALTAGAQETPHADAFQADMRTVHELLAAHEQITRTVTLLENGVQTLTESDDPQVAAYLKEHVASMDERLGTGEVFNVMSSTIPTIFEHADRIHTEIEETETGVLFIQTTDDPELVSVLQAHAAEVSELADEGMAAMMRSMMQGRGGMMRGGDGGMMQGRGGGMMRGGDGEMGPSGGMMENQGGMMENHGGMMPHDGEAMGHTDAETPTDPVAGVHHH